MVEVSFYWPVPLEVQSATVSDSAIRPVARSPCAGANTREQQLYRELEYQDLARLQPSTLAGGRYGPQWGGVVVPGTDHDPPGDSRTHVRFALDSKVKKSKYRNQEFLDRWFTLPEKPASARWRSSRET